MLYRGNVQMIIEEQAMDQTWLLTLQIALSSAAPVAAAAAVTVRRNAAYFA